MPKKKRIKATLRRSDKWRALLTDTSPFEVPVIFSNDGMYKNLADLEKKSAHLKSLIHGVLLHQKNRNSFKIPYRFRVVKDSVTFRQLSLLHPASQINISDFYQKYHSLICYYGSKGSFSIRYPKKVGGTYYFKSSISDSNKYKNDSVDTTDVDKLTQNPASYFAYSSFDRLHKFFNSAQYLELEKRFSLMGSLDVSKCFDSIYTHSIAWAVKEKFLVKDNITAITFGSKFDDLMQKMNLNETNGICIGPEASRIFAEIIMAKVDENVELELSCKYDYKSGRDYECRRYVDNIYIFTNSPKILEEVHQSFAHKLREYNLHLNEGKSDVTSRPFYTKKAKVVDSASKAIDVFCGFFLETFTLDDVKVLLPRNVKKHSSVRGQFIRDIKDICFSTELGYDAISSYVVSAMCKRIKALIEGYEIGEKSVNKQDTSNYSDAIILILDVMFFFFTIHPTVSSSLKVAQAIILSADFYKKIIPTYTDSLKENVLDWTSQLLKSPTIKHLLEKSQIVPIEFLNILVSLQEIDETGEAEASMINVATESFGSDNYFTIISKLYIYKNYAHFNVERQKLVDEIYNRFASEERLVQSSENIHLLFDFLSCPYVDTNVRSTLLSSVWPKLNDLDLLSLKGVSVDKIVAEIEEMPWFVNWTKIDLLTLIEKKELSAVY
jgi:hypothetical protein